tara:strand:- start:10103 stop:11056 length:954 start_codon:yes stop_codon:yes gene_type:complete
VTVNVGVIGCGRWGMAHLKTLKKLKHKKLVSKIHACDIDQSKEIEVSGLVDSFSASWQEMLEHESIDIVAIVTPLETHSELTFDLMDKDPLLLIEKPLCNTQEEAIEILSRAQDKGNRMIVGHLLRFHQSVIEAKELIFSGAVGELQRIDFARITTRPPPASPNVFDAFAIHGIDTACYCFGEMDPSRITIDYADSDTQGNPTHAKMSVEFPGHKEASIEVGWGGTHESRIITFSGNNGTIVIDTGLVGKIKIFTSNEIVEKQSDITIQPLEREWKLALDMVNNNSNHKIYPEPGTVLRCMKWIDLAKGEYKEKLRI